MDRESLFGNLLVASGNLNVIYGQATGQDGDDSNGGAQQSPVNPVDDIAILTVSLPKNYATGTAQNSLCLSIKKLHKRHISILQTTRYEEGGAILGSGGSIIDNRRSIIDKRRT